LQTTRIGKMGLLTASACTTADEAPQRMLSNRHLRRTPTSCD
jgi:hypothetical protein